MLEQYFCEIRRLRIEFPFIPSSIVYLRKNKNKLYSNTINNCYTIRFFFQIPYKDKVNQIKITKKLNV